MKEQYKIWDYRELLAAYEKGEVSGEEGDWFRVYYTSAHKKHEHMGWVPYTELKWIVELEKEAKKKMREALWGKK